MTAPASALPAGSPPTPEQVKLAEAIAARQAVQGRGVTITLSDGRSLDLRYGMAGIVALEEEFGSLQGVARAFGALSSGEGAVFSSILKLVAAGLTHHGITKAELMRHDLLDLPRLMEYGEACAEAFERAFPAPAGDGSGEAPGQAAP